MQSTYEPSEAAIDSPKRFKKHSVWLMIGLTIITLSLYLPYWMYTRTKTLNEVTGDEDVSQLFTTFVVSLFVLTFFLDASSEFLELSSNVARVFKVLGFASNICVLIWALMFRTALNGYTKSKPRDELWSNAFFTWFFQAFYHQYKINQIVDIQNASTPESLPATD